MEPSQALRGAQKRGASDWRRAENVNHWMVMTRSRHMSKDDYTPKQRPSGNLKCESTGEWYLWPPAWVLIPGDPLQTRLSVYI